MKPMLKALLMLVFVALAASGPLVAHDKTPVAASAVPGVRDRYLEPGFWIARLQHPHRVLLDPAAIRAQNSRMLRLDPSMHDLDAVAQSLDGARVAGWINALASRPRTMLYDAGNRPISNDQLDRILDNRAVDAIPPHEPTRFGLIVRRAALRSFPTDLRVFSIGGDTDIDRFQESALFPGTPVVIAHSSRDGQWRFVVSPRYAAWIAADAVAEGNRAQVLGYARQSPARIVSGAVVRTAFVPEMPAVSSLPLDMGVRLPLPPAQDVVNGQNAYTAWTVLLPTRTQDGRLQLAPALSPRNADTTAGALPLTQANVLRQAFKFLGERYGWGHDYGTRDCSGFVSEIFASMGVLLPRNTGDQARSPVLERQHFGDGDARARAAALVRLRAGDLIYIPGHVMLVIGRIDGAPYVIHDIHGGKVRNHNGGLRALQLNAVSVTPLLPLRFDDGVRFVDRITDVVRIGQAAGR